MNDSGKAGDEDFHLKTRLDGLCEESGFSVDDAFRIKREVMESVRAAIGWHWKHDKAWLEQMSNALDSAGVEMYCPAGSPFRAAGYMLNECVFGLRWSDGYWPKVHRNKLVAGAVNLIERHLIHWFDSLGQRRRIEVRICAEIAHLADGRNPDEFISNAIAYRNLANTTADTLGLLRSKPIPDTPLKAHLRIVSHTSDEVSLGHVMFFQPITEADGIVATLNTTDFSTLNAITRTLDIPDDAFRNYDKSRIARFRNTGKIPSVEDKNGRRVYAIPRTQGFIQTRKLAVAMLEQAASNRTRMLEIASFGFIQGDFPEEEIAAVLEAIQSFPQGLYPESVIVDIDSRHEKSVRRLVEDRSLNMPRRTYNQRMLQLNRAPKLNKDFLALKEEIVRRVSDSLADFEDLPGEVFSSGLSALAPDDYYVMGLNPCGGGNYPSIADHVKNWELIDFSGFTDQSWAPEDWKIDCYQLQRLIDCVERRGKSVHQRTVAKLISAISPGKDIRSIFATNAIFAASKSAQSFREETGISLTDAFKKCWPIHQYFLSVVRPKIIICLGYGETDSAYSLMRSLTMPDSSVERRHRGYKCFLGNIVTENITLHSMVLGVFHPSYGYRLTKQDEEILRNVIPRGKVPE
jgi:hypothetical protein